MNKMTNILLRVLSFPIVIAVSLIFCLFEMILAIIWLIDGKDKTSIIRDLREVYYELIN